MRTTLGPPHIEVCEMRPNTELTVYRIVRSEHADDPVFQNSFRSSFDLEKPPRGVERSSAVIHMGISAYREPGAAIETARRWPKLGDYLARVVLAGGNGFNWARTGPPLHLTVWGDPVKLSEAVADITPIPQ